MSKTNNNTPQSVTPTLSSILQGEYTLDQVRELIAAGADVNQEFTLSRDQVTKLITQVLDEYDEFAPKKMEFKVTPLIYAVINKDLSLISLLLREGADVNKQTHTEYYIMSPVYQAIHLNYIEALKLLLDPSNNTEIDIRGALGNTPLYLAKSSEVVNMLLDHGADIAARDDEGYAPLHYAENVEVAMTLLRRGACIDAISTYGAIPLSNWIINNEVDLVAFFLDLKRNNDPNYTPGYDIIQTLHLCYFDATDKDYEIDTVATLVHIFASRGADFNQMGEMGVPLIHQAILDNNLPLLKALLKIDSVDKNISTEICKSPLEYAFICDREECFKILVDAGADLNLRNSNNQSLLEQCANNGDVDKVKLLVNYGADIRMMIDRQTGEIIRDKIEQDVEDHLRKGISDLIEAHALEKLDRGASLELNNLRRLGDNTTPHAFLPEIVEYIRSFLDFGSKVALVKYAYKAIGAIKKYTAQNPSSEVKMALIDYLTVLDDTEEEYNLEGFRDGYMSLPSNIAVNPDESQVDISGAIAQSNLYEA